MQRALKDNAQIAFPLSQPAVAAEIKQHDLRKRPRHVAYWFPSLYRNCGALVLQRRPHTGKWLRCSNRNAREAWTEGMIPKVEHPFLDLKQPITPRYACLAKTGHIADDGDAPWAAIGSARANRCEINGCSERRLPLVQRFLELVS